MSQAGPRRNPYAAGGPRASRRHNHNDPQEVVFRISHLNPDEKRIMDNYGGNQRAARVGVLDRIEDHHRQYNEPPVAKLGVQWECKLCHRPFKTLQKVAIHLISNEWKLRSWHCECGRVYGSANELTRHRKTANCVASVNTSLPAQIMMPPAMAVVPTGRTTNAAHLFESTEIVEGVNPASSAVPSTHSFERNSRAHGPAIENRLSPLLEHPDACNHQLKTICMFRSQCGFCSGCIAQQAQIQRQIFPETSEPNTSYPVQYSYSQSAESNGHRFNLTTLGDVVQDRTFSQADYFEGRAFASAQKPPAAQYGFPVASSSRQHQAVTIDAQPYPARRGPHPFNSLPGSSNNPQHAPQYDPAAAVPVMSQHTGQPHGLVDTASGALSGQHQGTTRRRRKGQERE